LGDCALFPFNQSKDGIAPLTGVIGAMQAMEAIKLVASIGQSLSGRLQIFDALRAEWRTVKVAKDAACAVCSAE
jgi:adenylyltransferase/sulfurtransferase